jgi:hypothetical protein
MNLLRAPRHELAKGARLLAGFMQRGHTTLGPAVLKRALALLGCAALLYFSAGGTLFHQHTDGWEKACHVCQSLHAPALAAASQDLVAAPELITRYSSPVRHTAPSDSVSLHRASRAPPAQ